MNPFLIALALLALTLSGCAVNSVLPGVDVRFHAGLDGPTASVGASADINMPEATCGLLAAIGMAEATGDYCGPVLATARRGAGVPVGGRAQVQTSVAVSTLICENPLPGPSALRPALLSTGAPR